MKKVYIKTYGCQMNERDSEACAAMFVKRGFQLVDCEEDADILIFNTCSVRDQAERKAIGKVGIMKKLKRIKPELIIGVMGCMAQNHGDDLLEKLPHLDFVIGTGQLHRVVDITTEIIRERQRVALTAGSSEVSPEMSLHYNCDNNAYSAFISIMRGCNRFCSYCIVPYVRGREISRESADILSEAQALADSGIKEITLLGQNVAAYGLQGNVNAPPDNISPFADLLTALNEVEKIERIRFISPYPSYFNDRLIDTIAALPKVCSQIHLPLQSGSDRILEKMNRQYTAEKYLNITGKLKEKIADVCFSTDIIVGFPGESEEDFRETRRIMDIVGFDNAYIFKYSPRRGTKAAELEDQVPQKIKAQRNQILLDDLRKRALNQNKKYIGRTLEVMASGPSKRNASRWSGSPSNGKTVIFAPPENIRPGDLYKVKIARASASSLFGSL